jgi:hypothetical protein
MLEKQHTAAFWDDVYPMPLVHPTVECCRSPLQLTLGVIQI